MVKSLYLLTILVFLTNCTAKQELHIERKYKVLVNNESCNISLYYPVVKNSKLDSATIAELNWLLYMIPDPDFYAHRCNEPKSEKVIVSGDFRVLLQNDSILSIEYITVLRQYYGNRQDVVYHSLVLNTNSIKENKIKRLWGTSPEQIIPGFDRSKLKRFVERYNKTAERKANILAYERDSDYAITWGITKDFFILYVAGEGEFFGYEKIEIPLDEWK